MVMKFSKTFQRFLWAYAVFSGLNGLRVILNSFNRPEVYRKDFVQGYLLAQALWAGIDPYQDVSSLANQLALNSPLPIFPHPTPHTVLMGLLTMPLSFWGYEHAAQLWCAFALLCLTASLILLARWWQGDAVEYKKVFLLGWVLLGWGPVIEDLWTGQFNAVLLLILILAWQSLRKGQEISGGIWLGSALAMKLTAWPVVLFLIWKRRWRSVIAAGVTGFGFQLLSAAFIGIEGVIRYYTKVGTTVSALYREVDVNYSASAFGWRLFAETGSAFITSIRISPLIKWQLAAKICSVLFPVIVLAAGLWLANNSKSFDTAFALLLCVSLLVNPVAWNHYFVILLLPLAILIRHLQQREFPLVATRGVFIFMLVSSLSASFWCQTATYFQKIFASDGRLAVPFAAGLLTFTPAYALFALIFLIWRNARQTQPVATELFATGD